VKFAKAEADTFVFQLGEREKDVLLEILKLYPLIPPSHHSISRFGEEAATKEHQKLLDEYFRAEISGKGSKAMFERLCLELLGKELQQLEDEFVTYILDLR